MFSSFRTVPGCDGQTDGQTHDDNIYRASIASRDKNPEKAANSAEQGSTHHIFTALPRRTHKMIWHTQSRNTTSVLTVSYTRKRSTFSKSVMVSVAVLKLDCINLIKYFLEPGAKLNGQHCEDPAFLFVV